MPGPDTLNVLWVLNKLPDSLELPSSQSIKGPENKMANILVPPFLVQILFFLELLSDSHFVVIWLHPKQLGVFEVQIGLVELENHQVPQILPEHGDHFFWLMQQNVVIKGSIFPDQSYGLGSHVDPDISFEQVGVEGLPEDVGGDLNQVPVFGLGLYHPGSDQLP